MSSLVCGLFSQTQKIVRQVEILGIGWPGVIGLTWNESVPWEVMPRYSSVLFEKWGTISFQIITLNRTLEYLRHNFPWDKLISRQTDNPWPSYSQYLNPPDYFLRGTWKAEFVKTIHRQERTSPEKKSNGLHEKCSIELWTILLFELLLCCHTAAQCMEQT